MLIKNIKTLSGQKIHQFLLIQYMSVIILFCFGLREQFI